MQDVGHNMAAQRELYGAPLAEITQEIRAALGLTQARLAQALSVSAPMLSQLISAQRVKIGNPAVVHRLQALLGLARAASTMDPAAVQARIAEITAEQATITGSTTSATEQARAAAAYLRRVATPAELAALAGATTNERLAALLLEAAGG